MKIKTDDLLKGLKLIIEGRVGPLEKRLARVEAENAALRQAMREQKPAVTTPAEMATRYETLQ